MFPLNLLLNWRVVAAILLSVGLAATHWKAYTTGKQTVQAAWNAEKLETAKQTVKVLEANTAKAVALQNEKDALRKSKNAEIDRLNTDLADALERLRNRPDRGSQGGMPGDTSTGPATGCTGAGLYREDADFLVREAARAKRILFDLGECQAAYDKARAALK